MNKTWTDKGWDGYEYWQGQDRKTLKQINKLLKDIERNGLLMGIGRPEALKGDKAGWYSRQIDEANRLVYKFEDEKLVIAQGKGHYDDK